MTYTINNSAGMLTITYSDGSVINASLDKLIATHIVVNDVFLVFSYRESFLKKYDNQFGENTIKLNYAECTSPVFADASEMFTFVVGTVSTNQSSSWSRYSEDEVLVTTQALTSSYADIGAEIDVIGYRRLGVFVTADVNDSLNVTLKALAKHESAGVAEYELDGIGTKELWSTGASDFKKYYEIEVNAIPYIQLQAIADTVGATAGTLSIVITKIY